MITVILYVLLGITAGTLSGLIGIGGGVIIVPALVFVFGLTQHAAQGTTLAWASPDFVDIDQGFTGVSVEAAMNRCSSSIGQM